MTTIAFVPDVASAPRVVQWTQALAEDEESLEFLCWEGRHEDSVVEAVRKALGGAPHDVKGLSDPEPISTVVARLAEVSAQLLVTVGFHLAGGVRPRTSDALVEAAPCRTFVALYGDKAPEDIRNVVVCLDGTAHDQALVDLARTLHDRAGMRCTLAAVEPDSGPESEELGLRELGSALHDVGVKDTGDHTRKVVVDSHPIRGMLRLAESTDLLLVGATGMKNVAQLERALGDTTVSAIKRKPALRRRAVPDWIPRIHPKDYVELVDNLRSGSRWRADFWVMLAMASSIATLGLLQNSPAVVIGSMLLAPLMTPMIGFGLSLVQANPRLGRTCLRSVGLGILLTLIVSFAIGALTPGGETLSPETLSRGKPNLLDLGIAFFAAIAAAFALARPTLSGAVAGVAIATALVPPLCAVGISLAYRNFWNAAGAGLLFVTNFLAIVIAATLTFGLMGVSAERALAAQRRWARHAIGAFATILLLLSVPLGIMLADHLEQGRAQPIAFPVTQRVNRAVLARLGQEPGAELLVLARSAKRPGVYVHIATEDAVNRALGEELKAIIRTEMDNPDLQVTVVAVRQAWRD